MCCGCVCSTLRGDPPEQSVPPLPAPAPCAIQPRGHCSWAEQNSPAGISLTAFVTEHLPAPQPFRGDRNISPGSKQGSNQATTGSFSGPQGNARHQTCPTGHGVKFSLCPQSSSFHTNSSVLSSTNPNPEPVGHSQFQESLKRIPNLHSSLISIRSANTW